MAFLLHFRGTGYGYMSGVSEYVQIEDVEDEAELETEDKTAPGFVLVSVTDIGDTPDSLPTDSLLVPRY